MITDHNADNHNRISVAELIAAGGVLLGGGVTKENHAQFVALCESDPEFMRKVNAAFDDVFGKP